MQPARDLVGGVLELAAGVQRGQHDLRRRLARLLVGVDRDAAPVVAHRAGSVRVQDDLDAVAVAGERLVDRVVHDLVDEVVEAVGAGVADVHGRALADRLEPLEDLDVAGGVRLGHHAAPRSGQHAHVRHRAPLTSHHAAARVHRHRRRRGQEHLAEVGHVLEHTAPGRAGRARTAASSSSSTGGLPTASATGPRLGQAQRERHAAAAARASRTGAGRAHPARCSGRPGAGRPASVPAATPRRIAVRARRERRPPLDPSPSDVPVCQPDLRRRPRAPPDPRGLPLEQCGGRAAPRGELQADPTQLLVPGLEARPEPLAPAPPWSSRFRRSSTWR